MDSSPPRRRSDSATSRFYEADAVDHGVRTFIDSVPGGGAVRAEDRVRQSRHLPLWAWRLVARLNGIPLRPGSRPLLGTLLHALTLSSALGLAVSHTWRAAVAGEAWGAASALLLVYSWCGFGLYCKELCGRLFLHRRFLKDVRLHARTVFRVNGALLAALLGLLFTGAHVAEAAPLWWGGCGDAAPPFVCRALVVSSVAFSLLTLLWHSLVAFVFMSVCRTHTIGLRRFIKEIECDASLVERHLSATHKMKPIHPEDIRQESLWIAEDEEEDYPSSGGQEQRSISAASLRDINPGRDAEHRGELSVLFSPIVQNTPSSEPPNDAFIPVRRMIDAEDSAPAPHTMTNAELMHHFWKLNCRLRFSSHALQRWYFSFTALSLLRCSAFLVRWLGLAATLPDILQFLAPMALLLVLSTAIAEVNFEGQRVLRNIYPVETRIKPLQYMALNPLQISVYGFGLTHGTLVTVVFAVLVAFVSKIIISEISRN